MPVTSAAVPRPVLTRSCSTAVPYQQSWPPFQVAMVAALLTVVTCEVK
ncbi:MAG: hypothetical protein ABI807_05550 [Sporichthyaceae bacterium]